ncbi:Deoxyribose-phosphate aldolase [Planctomycetes bacterium Pla163]|uniref:Deoxyribose-phosphate aldolase n=1 Tax=Rohdeia mirabilis TaxID=2528008 RepID=A0A518D107_9BACT|nr:Deoxyribose-phosphate aldolase [Planctomycetes bacterium Pla163]
MNQPSKNSSSGQSSDSGAGSGNGAGASHRTGRAPAGLPAITVDARAVEARAARFTRRSIKNEAKRAALAAAMSMVDLTTLEGMDTPGKVERLCRKALQPGLDPRLPRVAAVCVYPTFVAHARQVLEGSDVRVAAVATAFPSGQSFLDVRLDETRRTVDAGAHEIDMVIDRGAFLAGDHARVFDEIAATKEACGAAHLKVILETGELSTYDNVRTASDLAMRAGADFIKTSTGKIAPASTMPVCLVMAEAIRDHYRATGVQVGLKAAGGIRTSKQAWHYLVLIKETLGDAWLTPDWFRIGASSLVNDLLLQWERLDTGRYQSAVYFSND